jgi:L-fuculose-phosphate aldolase
MRATEHTAGLQSRFQAVGTALMRVDANNTHSGNMSARDENDPDLFHVTASGAQCGALTPRDIVPLRFSGVSWGDARASSESNIHRRVLELPGVGACVHSHPVAGTLVSFDSPEKPLFLIHPGHDAAPGAAAFFQPVDFFGAALIGAVPVGAFVKPVGSAEMEVRIPDYLRGAAVTIVKGHGPFARGRSLEECLRALSVLENSARLAVALRRRGVDLLDVQRKIAAAGFEAVFDNRAEGAGPSAAGDRLPPDPSVVADFAYWLDYNYRFAIGAYGTGSMSQKVSEEEMLYCPVSAVPRGMGFALRRLPVRAAGESDPALGLHRMVYAHTRFTACMVTSSPLATAEAMAVLAETAGANILAGRPPAVDYRAEGHPVVTPIDAEALYLNPRLGVVDFACLGADPPQNPILDMLRWHKGCCIAAGYGVIAAGETTLEQAAHLVASAERIARYRQEVILNHQLLGGPAVESFQPNPDVS